MANAELTIDFKNIKVVQAEIARLKSENERKWVALHLLLDNIDYVAGNCRLNEMVGAVLPKEIIKIARDALIDADRS